MAAGGPARAAMPPRQAYTKADDRANGLRAAARES
jgi:hypothetical protein